MPLSSKGEGIKREFQSRYGSEKGERVFYATATKKPAFDKAVHGGKRKMGKRAVSGRRR